MHQPEIYLLSGFLGSGKTTLLKNLLQIEKKEGRTVAVLMNELGKVSIDSDVVDEDVPLKELLDGCICCTIQDKLEAQLQGLLFESKPDVIYIEATGAAHPLEIIDAVLSPVFVDIVLFKGIITVVDGRLWLSRKSFSPQVHQLLIEQVKYANLLIINKSDLLTSVEQSNLSNEIAMLNPNAFTILTTFSKVPIKEVRKLGFKQEANKLEKHTYKKELQLRAFVYQFQRDINQSEFESFLQNLPSTIYRIKGYLKFSATSYPYSFQYSFGMPIYMKEYMNMPLNMVFIGEQIEWNDINNQLRQLEGK